jgi:hypothetical protein
MGHKFDDGFHHGLENLVQRGNFRVDHCLCGHLHLHIGYTALTLDQRSARIISEMLAVALHKVDSQAARLPASPLGLTFDPDDGLN